MTKEFNELGLSDIMLTAVDRLGYESPTPVQEMAIPLILERRDIAAAAKTGTGKTAAFSLPCMDRLDHIQRGQGPKMLVVTPTRELAMQIASVCSEIAQVTHHRVLSVVGGVSYDPQITRLKQGVDILIATPGRLIDLIEKQAVKLDNIEVLVLDEADRMLDMGFWPSVKKIVAKTPHERQTLLFSATLDRAITNNIDTLLRDPSFVEISHKGETADTVEQFIIRVSQINKPELLKATLKEKGANRVIVFARTRSRADSNTRRLRRAGFAVEALHSDRSQAQRKRALDNFSNGKTSVLVATDVLARGIDVSEVDYVINYDLPNQPEDYVHRIGRTGRAGEAGFAISFVSPDQESWLRDIERLTKQEISEIVLKDFDPEQAEKEAAARSTRHAAKTDPELAAAASEYAKKQKRKQAATQTEQGDRKPLVAPGNERAAQKPRQKKSSAPFQKTAKKTKQRPNQSSAKQSSPKKSGPDMRPGRAQRAALARKRSSR